MKNQKTILIVDDNARNRLLLQEIFLSTGYKTILAENGVIAIDFLKKVNVDMIFMDIEMPQMNGIETIKYIRNNFSEPQKNIPIIILTAHNLNDFINSLSELDYDGIIEKPYSPVKITEYIDKYLS